MASVPMDVVEIRRTVYGKAMREPIADACEKIRRRGSPEGTKFRELQDIFATRIRMIRANPIESWYTYDYEITPTEVDRIFKNFNMISTREEITSTLIDEEEYYVEDTKEEDGVELISDTEFCWTIYNPAIGSHYHHGEDHELVLIQARFG